MLSVCAAQALQNARGATLATAEFFRAPDLAHGSRIPRIIAWLEEWAELLLRSFGRDREQLQLVSLDDPRPPTRVAVPTYWVSNSDLILSN